MPTPPLSRSSVTGVDRLTFASLLGGIVMLGLALQVFLLTQTTTWTIELERIATLVPVMVGALAYVRNRPEAEFWEIGVVIVWGILSQWFAYVVWFFAGPALAGAVSVSAVLLSGGTEIYLSELLQYLGTIAAFAGFYTTAASQRDRPVVSVITLLAVPVMMVVIYTII